MNTTEIKKILTIIQTAYPTFKVERMEDTVKLWSMMLKDYTYQQISTSLQIYIYNNKFPPTIADLVQGLNEITSDNQDNYEEAWTKVLGACRHTYTEKYWDKLPDRIKKCTSVTSLREWAMMDTATLNTVVKSNWIKAYQQVIEREKKYGSLPSPVLQAIGITRNELGMVKVGGEIPYTEEEHQKSLRIAKEKEKIFQSIINGTYVDSDKSA